MRYAYHTEHRMTYTELDQHERLSPVFAISLTQDVTTRYYETIRSDNIYLRGHYQAVWVITKTRLHMLAYPSWEDTLSIDSYTTKVERVKACLETVFRSEEGKLLFVCQQEFCPIDVEKRCIRRLSSIGYPPDMETTPPLLDRDFARLRRPFSEAEKVGTRRVLYTDLDYSNHTNNVYYMKYLLDTAQTGFWEKRFLRDIEIHYLHESREGAELALYRAEEPLPPEERITLPADAGAAGGSEEPPSPGTGKGLDTSVSSMEFLIKSQEKEITRARIQYNRL